MTFLCGSQHLTSAAEEGRENRHSGTGTEQLESGGSGAHLWSDVNYSETHCRLMYSTGEGVSQSSQVSVGESPQPVNIGKEEAAISDQSFMNTHT